MQPLLDIQQLTVQIAEKKVLKDVSLSIRPGEIHALMGPNGSGKTSLAYAVLGHPGYQIVSGSIVFEGKDLADMKTEERAKLGIFLSFQEPPEVGGVGMETFLRTVIKQRDSALQETVPATGNPQGSKERIQAMKKSATALRAVKEMLVPLGLSEPFLARYLNEGFSGGEKKKSEILQLLAFKPRLAIIDEVDSGLDIDSLATIASILRKAVGEGMGLLLISHYTRLFKELKPNFVHVLYDGELARKGDARLLEELDAQGYRGITKELTKEL